MKRAWTWKNKCSYGNHTWVSLFWQWSHPPHGSSSPLTLSILLSFCSLPPRATLCLCLPQQAILGSTAPLVSKDPIPVHQHGRPYLLQLVPCVERGPPTLLGCCQSLQNTPFQCYIKHFKKATSLLLLKGGLQHYIIICFKIYIYSPNLTTNNIIICLKIYVYSQLLVCDLL